MRRRPRAEGSRAAALVLALRGLDERLTAAVVAKEESSVGSAVDPWSARELQAVDCLQLLAKRPMVGSLASRDPEPAILGDPVLGPIATKLGLEPFDVELVLLAAAPRLDPRYGPVYAYLQDRPMLRRATIGLALALYCRTPASRIAGERRLQEGAPLLQRRVVVLGGDAEDGLDRIVDVDPGILRRLGGDEAVDPRVAPLGEIKVARRTLRRLPVGGHTVSRLRRALAETAPLRLAIGGPTGSGHREVAEAIASALGLRLFACDLSATPDRDATAELVLREALLGDSLAFLEGVDADAGLLARIGDHPGPIVVAAPATAGWPAVDLPQPDRARRRARWAKELRSARIPARRDELDALADRFALSFDDIDAVIAEAARRCELSVDGVLARARGRVSEALAGHTRRIEPAFTWDDVVLPDPTLTQLHELCRRVDRRRRVLEDWGFGLKIARSPGVTALFTGPSGTGKTMVAEIIAGELGLDLHAVDLSAVVSKYIGETEKNLRQVFDAASHGGAVLFFDEADALFGRRSEVRDSHDRYANLEVAFLLQEMERHPGVAILATNLVDNLDDAFARRLTFRISFGLPGATDRHRIWQQVWPAAAPLGDVDLERTATDFELSGGAIRNAALAAAFLAADEGVAISQQHLVEAVHREFAKLGTVPPPARRLAVAGSGQ